MTDAMTKLNRIRDAMLESIMEMTPEELRQSFIDDGEDPDQIVAEQRGMIAKLIADHAHAMKPEDADGCIVAHEAGDGNE